MAHPDVPAEQAHVDHAYERLEAMRASASARLREAFGEGGGTFQAVTERDIRVRTSLNRLEQLEIGGESLVFGRIDRGLAAGPIPSSTGDGEGPAPTNGRADDAGPGDGVGAGAGGGEVAGDGSSPSVYALIDGSAPGGPVEVFRIGRLAIADVDQEPLVVDWRAPVAEPFYRATGAHPMGLRRRRHFLTEGRRILDLEDELFGQPDAGDELGLGLSGSQVLFAVLERSRTGRIRDIVATVQREQDEIIRGPLSGILVVQGGPGTGKTAVALHRAAYLLYTHRFPLERQGVLVVGPNPLFLRYVEHVLPSLGESGVELSTIGGLFIGSRADPEATTHELPAVTQLKGDPRMVTFLNRAVADRQRPLRRTLEVPWGRTVLRLSPQASREIVTAARRRRGTHNARRRLVETLLWRYLHQQLPTRDTPATGEPEEVYTLDGEPVEPEVAPEPLTPADLGRELRRRPEVAEALDRMWPLLSPQQLLHDLFGAPPLVELAGRELLSAEERPLLERPRAASVTDVAWTEADLALLDEAGAVLGPARRRAATEEPDGPRRYGHIVVDEAQDLSPMQLRMLARRSLSGSMTVVGDVAQGTGAWAPETWDEVLAYLPERRGARQVELTVNYRTPTEIMELAARVLGAAAPGLRPPESVRVSGRAPRFIQVSGDDGAELAMATAGLLAGEEAELPGSVAVLAPPSLLDLLGSSAGRVGVAVGRPGAGALDTKVTLLTLQQAKGLEFDSVVVVEPAAIVEQSIQGLRALYVALTRATRRLTVIHSRDMPVLTAARP